MAGVKSGTLKKDTFSLQTVSHRSGNGLHNEFAQPTKQIHRLSIRRIYPDV